MNRKSFIIALAFFLIMLHCDLIAQTGFTDKGNRMLFLNGTFRLSNESSSTSAYTIDGSYNTFFSKNCFWGINMGSEGVFGSDKSESGFGVRLGPQIGYTANMNEKFIPFVALNPNLLRYSMSRDMFFNLSSAFGTIIPLNNKLGLTFQFKYDFIINFRNFTQFRDYYSPAGSILSFNVGLAGILNK